MSLFGKNTGEEQNERREKPNNTNIVMCIVCVYLIYLGADILKKFANGQGGGTPAWVQIVFGVVFIVAGAFLLLFYIKAYIRGRNAENEQEKEDGEVLKEIEEKTSSGETAEKASPESKEVNEEPGEKKE